VPRLRRSDVCAPGIARRRAGRGFVYLDADGERVADTEVLSRIHDLVIPPAWREVWICPYPGGHIQATGIDQKGRKQYLYHPKWRERRDQEKFDEMLSFARALPRLREVPARAPLGVLDRGPRGHGHFQRSWAGAVTVRALPVTTPGRLEVRPPPEGLEVAQRRIADQHHVAAPAAVAAVGTALGNVGLAAEARAAIATGAGAHLDADMVDHPGPIIRTGGASPCRTTTSS